MVLREEFKKDFSLTQTGSKGWYYSHVNSGLKCPKCGNSNPEKLAFVFDKNSTRSSFHCLKCSCSSSLEKFLFLSKKREYITNYKPIKRESILEKKSLSPKKEKISQDLQETILPLFFKRLKFSKYLMKRGATLELFKYWIIGKTDFEDNLKNYVIFVITENKKEVGWVARSLLSKEEIEKHNKESKYKILRWRNSKNDFGKIVFGLDEVSEKTEQIIVVEGITSKMRIDCELKLYSQNKIKCCCTFGKKMTNTQLNKIINKNKNLKELILFYDSDAIAEIKNTAFKIYSVFKNVKVAFCPYKDEMGKWKDAGDLNKKELLSVLNNTESPFAFFSNKLQKKSLM